MKKNVSSLFMLFYALFSFVTNSSATEGLPDPYFKDYNADLKGKRVVFVPLSMGIDIPVGAVETMKKSFAGTGINFEIMDANWSGENGAKILNKVIREKPAVIIAHNPDVTVYAKILQSAEKQGIWVINFNMGSSYKSSAFVGANYQQIGMDKANEMLKHCGKDSGKSDKIAIIRGEITSGPALYDSFGIYSVLEKHPEIKVVSDQAANWRADKAKSIVQSILKQHPDLCGILGGWDNMDSGTGLAIKEAGLSGKVKVITNGAGHMNNCKNVENGLFDVYFAYNTPVIGDKMASLAKLFIQNKSSKPGSMKVSIFENHVMITKDNLEKYKKQGYCWDKADFEI